MTGVVVSGGTKIPVRNLWLLMFYASRLFATNVAIRGAGVEKRPDDLPDLVAEILANAVERRLQRNLTRSYVPRQERLTRVRGRIDVLETASNQLLSQGRIACRFTSLEVDTPRNRLLCAALTSGAAIVRNPALAHRCRKLAGLMHQAGVTPVLVHRADIDSITLSRNDVIDADAVNAARLLLRMNIPSEEVGTRHRMTPSRDPVEIRRLYEAAVRGFYRVTLQPPWRVHRSETRHVWPVDDHSPNIIQVLPVMRTDIIIESADRRIIVETKFADALKPNQYDTPKLDRGHIFQIYAYVQSQSGRDALAAAAEGVLLYPVVKGELDEFVIISGHRYRFMTVDLTKSAMAIRERLLVVVNDR